MSAAGWTRAPMTPALLLLASGSLIATALVRLACVVDRVRKLAGSGEAATPGALHLQAELKRWA